MALTFSSHAYVRKLSPWAVAICLHKKKWIKVRKVNLNPNSGFDVNAVVRYTVHVYYERKAVLMSAYPVHYFVPSRQTILTNNFVRFVVKVIPLSGMGNG